MSCLRVVMRSNRHLLGRHLVQVLLALLLTLIVAEGASAADMCDCPDCPAHACMQMGCPMGDDGHGCIAASDAACTDGIALPFAPRAEDIVPAHGVAASSVGIPERVVAWTPAMARRALAPPVAAPAAHIVFCRLRR